VFDRILQGAEDRMPEFFELYFKISELRKKIEKLTEEVDADENMRFISNKMKEEGEYALESKLAANKPEGTPDTRLIPENPATPESSS
jgi:CO dehydrogenase nickel-insertion accessory protein CooC1